MKKKETREMIITYCDYCEKELEPPYSVLRYPDGKEVDLCNELDEHGNSCLSKYQELQLAKRAAEIFQDIQKEL